MIETVPSVAAAILFRRSAIASGKIPARVLFSKQKRFARDISFVALQASRLEEILADVDHPEFETANRFQKAVFQPGVQQTLPAVLTANHPVSICDVLLDPYSLPADFLNDPLDLQELFLQIDELTGFAKLSIPLADNPTDRALNRIKKLQNRDGVELNATVVQAPAELYQAGEKDLPCMVLITFDKKANEPKFLFHIARYLNSLSSGRFRDEDRARAARMLNDPRFVRNRRREVPESLCDGQLVYLCDLIVHRPFLVNGLIDGHTLPCLADYGDQGRIELMPFAEP